MKSVRVTDEMHKKLLRVMGTLQAREGKRRAGEDAVEFLLEEYERNKERKLEVSATSG